SRVHPLEPGAESGRGPAREAARDPATACRHWTTVIDEVSMNIRDIKKLREVTGCGVMEARRALGEAGGDPALAAEVVRQRQQGRPQTRPVQAGAVFAYLHHDRRLGSLVALRCGTDFVARSPLFRELGDALALHVAALAPAGVEELLGQPFV